MMEVPFQGSKAQRAKGKGQTPMDIDDLVCKLVDPEAILLEPRHVFNQAIIGVTESVGGVRVVVYDSAKCVISLMTANGWAEDEAASWFEYNTRTLYVGAGTPVFVDVI
jgi:hypothetical protein